MAVYQRKRIPPVLWVIAVIILAIGAAAIFLPPHLEVVDTIDAIDHIGDVTPDSLAAIEHADRLYNELSYKQQQKVSNFADLVDAKGTYAWMTGLIQEAEDSVSSITYPFQLGAGDQLKATRAKFDQLEQLNLGKYAAQAEEQLDALEYLYENDMAQLELEHAQSLFDQRLYAEALEAYDAVLKNYSVKSYDAREGAANCCAQLAQQNIYKGKLLDAYTFLRRVETDYLSTDSSEAVKATLDQQLSYSRPTSGRTIRSTLDWGYCELTINAGNSDVCVKVENRSNPGKFALVYVRAFESATVKMGDGNYDLKYTCGDYWFGTDAMFGPDASFSKADTVLQMETQRYGGSISYSSYSITLYSVVGGNLDTLPISGDMF